VKRELIWPVWIAASAVTFGVLEAVAYRTERFPTLSRTLAGWLGTYPAASRRDAALVAFGAAWLALTVHLATYRPRTKERR
jgi:hypothetical protein